MNAPNERLRLAQVGMGGWGRDWLAVTARATGVERVAWVDPSADARTATAALGVPADRVFPALATALAAVDADAVLVTATVEHHVPIAIEALDAGLHVLLEKPFAPSLLDAVPAVRAAASAGRILMISQNYRYHPAPRLAAELVAGGRIGPVAGVEVDFRRNVMTHADALRRHQMLVHPLLVDMAIHHFDMLRLVLGREAGWVDVTPIHPPGSAYRDAPAAYAILGFEGGVVASYRGSWISSGRNTPWGGHWRVEGATGAIEWATRAETGEPDRLRLRTTRGAARPQVLPDVPARDRDGSLAAFVDAVRTGREPETSARRNLATLALTLAAVRSAQEGRRVELQELLAELPEDLR